MKAAASSAEMRLYKLLYSGKKSVAVCNDTTVEYQNPVVCDELTGLFHFWKVGTATKLVVRRTLGSDDFVCFWITTMAMATPPEETNPDGIIA